MQNGNEIGGLHKRQAEKIADEIIDENRDYEEAIAIAKNSGREQGGRTPGGRSRRVAG